MQPLGEDVDALAQPFHYGKVVPQVGAAFETLGGAIVVGEDTGDQRQAVRLDGIDGRRVQRAAVGCLGRFREDLLPGKGNDQAVRQVEAGASVGGMSTKRCTWSA